MCKEKGLTCLKQAFSLSENARVAITKAAPQGRFRMQNL